ncbi:LysM peptidoglycan-binding domain-containing protein [Sulfuricella sp.]|uniref:LysM peptidoglycan-binding domain-containing protein n=1 Tax=Sulfuricella sp. TaxID=2099377 RepID=UPI002C4E8977|nr:LysM peptidoglycan-binding domain-containing protein [Sulfuricella sp.]HUX63981.1 LysM peptidoglycan-binding domain-containing protein [Sulfuricella sp.]
MRLIPPLILALASAFALYLPTASADDLLGPDSSVRPVKQALAETTEAELQLQPSNGILGSPSKENDGIASSEEPVDLWDRIRDGFALQELDSPLVQKHVDWYADRPEYVQRMVARSQLYLYHIVEEVEKRGMPTEVALLPMIESAFNPKAYSSSHASGIWQFIPSTGKHFGLEQSWWYDGRRDVTAATDAALDYLQKLHDMFDSWELALAAYNWGEGSVQRAIAKNRKQGLPTDYLSLTMPVETRNYLPKLMAIKQIIMDPAARNLALASIPNRPYFVSVTTTQHIDLAVAARLAEMPLHDFVSLNPAYNRPVINAKGSRVLLLPVGKADTFTSNLESYDKPLVSWKSYTPARGEKIDKVARRFSISVARLKEINSITKRNKLSAGQTLLVPLSRNDATVPDFDEAHQAIESEETEPLSVSPRFIYTVKKGDTLTSVAKRHKISAIQIKALNNLRSNRLSNGQKLVIRQETLAKSKLAAVKGKSVKLAVASKAKPVKLAAVKSAKRSQRYYTVRRGDTVASIAKQFNVASNDIQRWNNISGKRGLTPGNKVTLMLPDKG